MENSPQNIKQKKLGSEAALAKFAKKYPGGAELRQRQIDNIKKSNDVPVLAFTHPKDKFEGLLSDWLEEVPGVKRIVISEDFKINGKTKTKRFNLIFWLNYIRFSRALFIFCF